LTFAEVRGFPLRLEDGDPEGDFSCEVLPTLDEVFALARGQVVVELEVKAEAAGVIAAEYLRDQGLYGGAFLLCDPGECAAARAAVPDVPIMTRPQSADEVPAAVAILPAPIMVHIDPTAAFLADGVIDQIHGVGAKVYGNAFVAGDGVALGAGDLSGYLGLYDDGLEVVQSEYPHYLLQALGRVTPGP
jgi:glycerophosphoryl diester phosphodiesterase